MGKKLENILDNFDPFIMSISILLTAGTLGAAASSYINFENNSPGGGLLYGLLTIGAGIASYNAYRAAFYKIS